MDKDDVMKVAMKKIEIEINADYNGYIGYDWF